MNRYDALKLGATLLILSSGAAANAQAPKKIRIIRNGVGIELPVCANNCRPTTMRSVPCSSGRAWPQAFEIESFAFHRGL
jgi:hypothetical protein